MNIFQNFLNNLFWKQDKVLIGSDCMTFIYFNALIALWPRKMKIDCSIQTCPGQTDRRTDKVTPWASVGAKNNKYMLNSFNSWKLLKFSQFLRGVGSQSLISAQILLNSLWVFNLIIPLPQHGRLSKRRIVYQFPIDWQ